MEALGLQAVGGGWEAWKAVSSMKHLGGGWRERHECVSNDPDSGWQRGPGGAGRPPSAPTLLLSLLPGSELGLWGGGGGSFPSCPAVRGAALDPGTQEGQCPQDTVAIPTGGWVTPAHRPIWGDTGQRPVSGLLKATPPSDLHRGRTAAQDLPSEHSARQTPAQAQLSAAQPLSHPGSWRLGLVRHLTGLPTVGLSVHLLTSGPRLLCGLAQTGVEWGTQGLTGQEGDPGVHAGTAGPVG